MDEKKKDLVEKPEKKGLKKNVFLYVEETVIKREQKFERQNRYKMIKDICQK
jgi:hypothetical protein